MVSTLTLCCCLSLAPWFTANLLWKNRGTYLPGLYLPCTASTCSVTYTSLGWSQLPRCYVHGCWYSHLSWPLHLISGLALPFQKHSLLLVLWFHLSPHFPPNTLTSSQSPLQFLLSLTYKYLSGTQVFTRTLSPLFPWVDSSITLTASNTTLMLLLLTSALQSSYIWLAQYLHDVPYGILRRKSRISLLSLFFLIFSLGKGTQFPEIPTHWLKPEFSLPFLPTQHQSIYQVLSCLCSE